MTEQEKRLLRKISRFHSRTRQSRRHIVAVDDDRRRHLSGEAHGLDAILKRANILHGFNVNIAVEHVVFGLYDVALHLHNTGHYGGKVLDEHLTTVIHLDGGKIRRLDTFISDIPMLNA